MVEEENIVSIDNRKFFKSFDGAECSILNNDIFYVYFQENVKGDLESVKNIFEYYKSFSSTQLYKVIVEYGPYSSLEKDAREFIQNNKTKALCEALVIRSLAQRIMVNFMIKLKSHDHPSKAFKSLEEAISWSNKF